jgi:hypothetical protein
MQEITFQTRTPKKGKDIVDVRYDCACGCHPIARYERGSAQSGSQHCCCGIAHFAGGDADAQLRKYLQDRQADGQDEPGKRYGFGRASVKAPWGEELQVAYAIPASG